MCLAPDGCRAVPTVHRALAAYEILVYILCGVQISLVEGVAYEYKAQGTIIKALESGTMGIDFFIYPERITEKTNAKGYEFELTPDALEIMSYGVAGDLLKSDVSAEYGTIYATRYETMKQQLDPRYHMGSITIEGGVV